MGNWENKDWAGIEARVGWRNVMDVVTRLKTEWGLHNFGPVSDSYPTRYGDISLFYHDGFSLPVCRC